MIPTISNSAELKLQRDSCIASLCDINTKCYRRDPRLFDRNLNVLQVYAHERRIDNSDHFHSLSLKTVNFWFSFHSLFNLWIVAHNVQ